MSQPTQLTPEQRDQRMMLGLDPEPAEDFGGTLPSPKRPRRWLLMGIPVLTLLVGIGIGSAGEPVEAAPAAMPAPTKTVTEPPVETVMNTPTSCLKALDDADRAFKVSGKAWTITAGMMDSVTKAFEAIASGSLDEATAAAEEISTATDRLTNLREDKLEPALSSYGEHAEGCRAA